ncbi:class F sortase [Candidatus Saccharibacteria bacterium]|nr:class F sortase [Candidatus Saccharibacteria bacterium]
MKTRRRVLKTTISIALLVAGLGMVAFGLYGFIIRYKVTHEPNPTIPKEIVTKSIDTPSETAPVEACTNYDVPANQPRQISIPKLNKTGCVQKVGIDQNNAIAVPTNIHLAGWYTASSLPGESGVTLIDGHISGRYEDAIFAHLKDLKPGDEVKIQLGDKTWISYVIKDTNTYTIDKAAEEQLRQLSGVKSQLTIVTCGGKWLPHDKTYDKRVVVRAEMKGEDD